MGIMLKDVRYGCRTLCRTPGFFAVALLTVTLGIALNTSAFSIINALWFRPLPFADPGSLLAVLEVNSQRGMQLASPGDIAAWSDAQTVAVAAGLGDRMYNLGGGAMPGRQAVRVRGAAVTKGFIETLGFRPLRGRLFDTADYTAANPPHGRVVLIGERFWRNRLGQRADAVGSEVTLDGERATIIGILPVRFRYLFSKYDVVAPLQADVSAPMLSAHWLQAVVRVKPGVSRGAAESELRAIAKRLASEFPSTNEGWDVSARPLSEVWMREARQMYPVLVAAAGFVLLIVCANVSNLFLARSSARRHEIAVRSALGASRWAIVRQLLTEGLVLTAAGGLLALLICIWVRDSLVAAYPEMADLAIDFRVAACTLGVSLAAGLAVALAPAVSVSRPDLIESLKAGARSLSAGGGHRLRTVLVASEMAFAIVVLSATGMLIRTVLKLRAADPGFDTSNVLTLEVFLPDAKYPAGRAAAFYNVAAERLSALPGVESVTVASGLPLQAAGQGSRVRVDVEGRTAQKQGDYLEVAQTRTGGEYLKTLGIRLLGGRAFNAADREGAPAVAIINSAFLNAVWPKGTSPAQAIGTRFRIEGGPWKTIIGICGSARQDLLRPPMAEVFVPLQQDPAQAMSFAVRTPASKLAMLEPIRSAVRSLDPDLPLSEIRTMDDWKAEYMPRVLLYGLGVFAVVALALAAMGLYGLIAYLVGRRTREIGIRVALGAAPMNLVPVLLTEALRTTVAGIGAGLLLSLACAHALSHRLFGLVGMDPLVFCTVAAVLFLVALAAAIGPARRAARVDPINALRFE
ncbi:MAG: ABC transporter permease [Acidobacteriota bacterium]